MDAFYASVEQRDNPAIRGKPVVVGGGTNRGVVAAASYEVRKFGVRSAMPMSEATRRCPQLIRIAPRMSHYKEVSTQIFDVFREFTPLVEGLSLDEAFLDVTGSRALHGSGPHIAASIKAIIRERTQPGLASARARGRKGGRPKSVSAEKRETAVKLYREGNHSVQENGKLCPNARFLCRKSVVTPV